MIEYLALTVGGQTIEAPSSLPQPERAPAIINNALSLFITAGIIITVIFLILAGIKWITSGGDKQKLAQAKAQLKWSIVGLIIILLAFAIISIFNFMFGINLLNFNVN